MLSGVRGSRLLDRRPPHYRCPAVPGLSHSARAILMALGSSVLPSGQHLLMGTAYCSVLLVTWGSATLRQPVPCPSCVCSGLEPLPNFPARAPAADAIYRGTTNRHCGYCVLPLRSCSRRPLITAGHPVRSSVPSPSCNTPGFESSTTAPSCALQLPTAARQFISARPCDLPGYERNHIQVISQCLL